MPKNQEIQRIYYFLFLLLVFIVVLFVRSAIKSEDVDVGTRKEKKGFVVKPVKVKLNIIKSESTIFEYSVELQNDDTVIDLLEYLRSHSGFTYEKIAYIYGTEIDNVNNFRSPEGFKWRILNNGADITFEIGNINLKDKSVYEIKLVKSSNP